MSRTLIARVSAGVLLLTGCWIAYTQNQGKQPPPLTLNKVKDDLYEIEGDGGNVAVYVTSEGVILIDDKFDQDHENIMAQGQERHRPARQVRDHHAPSLRSQRRQREVHSHCRDHLDRERAQQHPGAQATECAAERDVRRASCSPRNGSVFLGGKEVRARYFGRGHTNGDAVIYFPH